MKRIFFLLLIAFVPPLSVAEPIDTGRVTKSLSPYLNDDTFAIATVAVDADWPEAAGNLLVEYEIVPEGEQATMKRNLAEVTQLVARFRELGAREISVIVAVADVRPNAGPLLLVTCEQPDKNALREMIERLKPGDTKIESVWTGDTLLLGTPVTVTRYPMIESAPREDLLAALKASAEGASGAAVVSAGNDVRRAIRELWPTLPQPFRNLDSDLLADGVRHFALTVRKPPEWQARLALVARDETSATKLKSIADAGLLALVKQASQERGGEVVVAMLTQAMPLLRPQQSGSELVVEFAHDNEAAKSLVTKAILPAIGSARASAQRSAQMNDMKQIALAMLNFESANKVLPAAKAICDKEGKPLLSWRVAVLPYLEGNDIYEMFRLDEPWDSEHNLKVAKENRPQVYFQSMSRQLESEGKTTYQVPVTEGTSFMPQVDAKLIERNANGQSVFIREGLRYRQVTDGSSQTVMVVQVADEHAVFWTKPEDWTPDLADPVAKLRQEGRDGFVNVFMDGSARYTPFSIDTKVLKSILTYNGGEVIDWSKQ